MDDTWIIMGWLQQQTKRLTDHPKHSLKIKKVGGGIYIETCPQQVCRKCLRSMGWKRVLSCFYFCSSNPFGKLASQAKDQVNVIKTEQQWENLWCVINLFVIIINRLDFIRRFWMRISSKNNIIIIIYQGYFIYIILTKICILITLIYSFKRALAILNTFIKSNLFIPIKLHC